VRTTLTIDDDVALKLRRLARQRQTSFKEVVNAVLRRGLGRQEPALAAPAPFQVEAFSSRFRPGVDPVRLNRLADDLEARDFGERTE
jgi:hypothetical protein